MAEGDTIPVRYAFIRRVTDTQERGQFLCVEGFSYANINNHLQIAKEKFISLKKLFKMLIIF